ncbi:MAG: DDE-type integrase/transposase/recombinase [Tateyamaria sp.]|uniref:DDE-type integrase/transposase/recombinase n=1 Tax=Tateyamaria sp. TaxID=1929288 RepID=UPI003283ABA8
MKNNLRRWHLDEMFLKINGEWHGLHSTVDHKGEVCDSDAKTTRNWKPAWKYIGAGCGQNSCRCTC